MSKKLKTLINNIDDFIIKVEKSLLESKQAADEFNVKDIMLPDQYLYKDKKSAVKARSQPELDKLRRLMSHKITLK